MNLLSRLETLGVRLSAKKGRLQVDAPAGALTAELKAQIRANKPALLLAVAPLFTQAERETLRGSPSADLEAVAAAKQTLWGGWTVDSYRILRGNASDCAGSPTPDSPETASEDEA